MEVIAVDRFFEMRKRVHIGSKVSEDLVLRNWDYLRFLLFVLGFFVGQWVHPHLLLAPPAIAPVFVAAVAFSTFLASFVLSIMVSTGKYQLDTATSGMEVNMMRDRLLWLLSDQLVMVVSALTSAALGLLWLAALAISQLSAVLTSLVFASVFLAFINAFRLAAQVWEIQSELLEDERRRAIKRLQKEVDEQLSELEKEFAKKYPACAIPSNPAGYAAPTPPARAD